MAQSEPDRVFPRPPTTDTASGSEHPTSVNSTLPTSAPSAHARGRYPSTSDDTAAPTYYSMKQTQQATGLNYETLKFYCNEGLIPELQRDHNNRRVFTASDIAWIRILTTLRQCGMSLADIRAYLELSLGGPDTIPQRQSMLSDTLDALKSQQRVVRESIRLIKAKKAWYTAVTDGTQEYSSPFDIDPHTPIDEIPYPGD